MEQRIYRGNFTPEQLADYVVQHYNQEGHLEGQKLGQGDSIAVQVGRRDGNRLRQATTIGIVKSPQNSQDVMVTLGEQEWIHTGSSIYPIAGTLVGALFTPWALFGLLWPAQHALGQHLMPNDIWSNIEFFVTSHGGAMVSAENLTHPHFQGKS